MLLSRGVTGISPQSRMVAQEVYGFRDARRLKPLKEVWRAEAARMARGPKRAPLSVISIHTKTIYKQRNTPLSIWRMGRRWKDEAKVQGVEIMSRKRKKQ